MNADAAPPPPAATAAVASPEQTLVLPSVRRLRAEVLIVLGLSLGKSGIYAIVRFIERNLAEKPVGEQTATLNPSYSGVNWLDLTYQILAIFFALMPVALAIYLLGANGVRALPRIGLTRTNANGSPRAWLKDVALGLALAAAIGLPGLALYAAGRALGQSVRINTNGLPDVWWAATILLASAAVAGIVEEVVLAYLIVRLRDLKWSIPAVVITAALLRGTYHLYQGWPMALGNVVMGVVFALVFIRTGRVGPLIIAHWTLDAVSFIGPEFLPAEWIDALNAS